MYPNQSPSMANHANLDTNAPHLASRGAFYCGEGCIFGERGAFGKSVQPKERVPGIIYKIVHTDLLLAEPLYGIYRLIG